MRFFLATKNKHKVEEFKRILSILNIEVISEADLDKPLPEVDETGTTFEDNAFLKAESAMVALGLPSIADDSGLCVDYLDGAPGIYSARFAGEEANDRANNEKLLKLLDGVPLENRTAKFVCSIACVFPDGRRFSVRGDCKGYIAFEPDGENGFGYDPLFVTKLGCFGKLSGEEKDLISHRGNALKKFTSKVKEYI